MLSQKHKHNQVSVDIYNVGGIRQITINYLVLYVKKSNNGDEHFKRIFILLLIEVFFAQKDWYSCSISKHGQSVNNIPAYNWLKFTFIFSFLNIKKAWFEKAKYLQGCLAFFFKFYFLYDI